MAAWYAASVLPLFTSPRCAGRGRVSEELSPHFISQLHDHPQLGPLLIFGQHIAFLGRGEAALWRQAKLVEPDIFRRLVDAAFDIVLFLKLAAFRGDQSEHELFLALGG